MDIFEFIVSENMNSPVSLVKLVVHHTTTLMYCNSIWDYFPVSIYPNFPFFEGGGRWQGVVVVDSDRGVLRWLFE